LSDAIDRGITVSELAPMDEAITMPEETTAAFVGRALRGPLHQPVLVQSLGEFRRRFGETWSRSSLGPAVQQFFDHGGKRLYVVRVANNARGAMLCLPASGSALVLRSLEPGSTERIRAAVDYDGIDADDQTRFNLTLQRIDPGTGLVIDQELYRKVDYREGTDLFVGDRLTTSSMARLEAPFPTHRPEVTRMSGTGHDSAYVEHVQPGSDGHELSDYDLIGSRTGETGLFALQQLERFDLLYLPPPGKSRDLGPASLLAAERFCRERGAMLIVDPSVDWTTPADAIVGLRNSGLGSPNAIGYFPRARMRDDEEGTPRAVGGALAGLLCRLDRRHGPLQPLDHHGLGLKRYLSPMFNATPDDCRALAREGLNTLAVGSAGRPRFLSSVTMSRGNDGGRRFTDLTLRRFTLMAVKAIANGTRWAAFEPRDDALVDRVRAQVTAFMAGLAAAGAFDDELFVVECYAGFAESNTGPEQGVTIIIVFQPRGGGEPVSLTLYQTAVGCRVLPSAFSPGLTNCA
jgi:hypothetical protein